MPDIGHILDQAFFVRNVTGMSKQPHAPTEAHYCNHQPSQPPGAQRKLVPIPEAMEYLGGVCRSTIYSLIDGGDLVRVHVGRRAFVTGASLAAYLDRLG